MYEAQINKSEKKRIGILDALRGIAICGMVLHHAVVSFEIVFSVQLDTPVTSLFVPAADFCCNISAGKRYMH